MNNDEGQEHHAQQGKLVGSGQQVLESHWLPPSAWNCLRAVAALRPVRSANLCDREGTSPSGRSSSIRSTLCMGKKTIPGESAPPSFSTAMASSKEASSIPHTLRPSGVTPQNLSRGFPRVATTTAP